MDVMGETALQELKGHQEPKVCVKYKRPNTKTITGVGISYRDILKWEGRSLSRRILCKKSFN